MLKIVFVCTGNICRSPMAEGLLRHKWQARGRDDLDVSSMGIHGLDREPATPQAQQICAAHGADISDHRSRPVDGEELRSADLVLCMEPAQRDFIRTFFPWFRERVDLLGAWPEKATRKSVVKDPIGGSDALYRKVFERIDRHIDRILPLLEDMA